MLDCLLPEHVIVGTLAHRCPVLSITMPRCRFEQSRQSKLTNRVAAPRVGAPGVAAARVHGQAAPRHAGRTLASWRRRGRVPHAAHGGVGHECGGLWCHGALGASYPGCLWHAGCASCHSTACLQTHQHMSMWIFTSQAGKVSPSSTPTSCTRQLACTIQGLCQPNHTQVQARQASTTAHQSY